MNVIHALKGDDNCLEWQGRKSIAKGRQLLSQHALWTIYYTHRDRNQTAHRLANWAKSQISFGFIDPVLLPPSVFCDRGGTMDDVCTVSLDAVDINADG